MRQQTTLFSEVIEPKKVKYLTHFYSKADIMKFWGVQDHQQFESLIGEEGKLLLGWRPGKQKFTPKQFRELINIVGMPLTKEELGY